MNTLPAVGTIFGSGFGAKLIGGGRARTFVMANVVGIIGAAFTFSSSFNLFLFAKFIVGCSIGMTGVTVARYIEEYVPLAWFGTSQAISLAFLQGGIFLSTMIGAILPPDEECKELKEDQNWRIIFAVQPILLIVTIILFYILVGHDPPRFLISQGMDDKAKSVI